jgi:hypothetical protein
MNNIVKKLLITICCSLVLTAVRAQAPEPLQDVMTAFTNDRISDLEKYFDNIVPVTINNVQSTYSRTQAELVLKDFFSRNAPQNFNVESSGSPDNTSKFAIGDFNTPSGKYSFYILLKAKSPGTYLLQEIAFNKE